MFQEGEEPSPPKCNVLNMNSQQSKTKEAVKCEPPEPDNHMANWRFEELQLTLVEQHPLVVPLLRALWLDEDSKDMAISTADGAVIKCHKNIFKLASKFCSELLTGCQEDEVVALHLPDINSSSVECFLNVLYCVIRVSPFTRMEMEVIAECLKIEDSSAALINTLISAKRPGYDRLVRHPKAFSDFSTTNCNTSESAALPGLMAVKSEYTVKTASLEEPIVEAGNNFHLQPQQDLHDVINDNDEKEVQVKLFDKKTNDNNEKEVQMTLSNKKTKTAVTNQSIKCCMCDKILSDKHNLKKHLKWFCKHSEHEDLVLKCSNCDKTFHNPYSLRAHKRTVHRILTISSEKRERWRQDALGLNSYTCTKCNQTFLKQSRLNSHEKRVHNKGPKKVCTTCGKSFASVYYLMEHEKSHTEGKPFSCTRCDKSFTTSGYLKEHEMRHDGIKKSFLCTQCDKMFYKLGDLKKHEWTHTGEKPYSCSKCDKRFAQSGQLKIHEFSHTGKKPFGCTKCDKRFPQLSHLKRHELSHTGDKPYKCKMCVKSFNQNSHLTRHMKTHAEEKQDSDAT